MYNMHTITLDNKILGKNSCIDFLKFLAVKFNLNL